MQILLKQYSTYLFLEFTMKKINWYIFLSYSCEWDMTDSTQLAYLFFQFSPEDGQALKITASKVKYFFFKYLKIKRKLHDYNNDNDFYQFPFHCRMQEIFYKFMIVLQRVEKNL